MACRHAGKVAELMKEIVMHTQKPYRILVGGGLLAKTGEELRKLGGYRKAAILTDDVVDALYAETVAKSLAEAGFSVCKFVFPNGEASKSIDTAVAAYGFLTGHGVTRGDVLVALGGGVTGDLTGFTASTYLRGVDYVQIPTTLLAQIDSSVGGKTAVNSAAGKNLIGTFWQPRLVLCDTDTLSTLSDEIFSDGVAEAIKYGMIRDRKLFETIEDGIHAHLADVIARCIAIKKQVVEADEFDKGERMLLNFGHTLGHAIEKQSQYEVSHGKAVAIGMQMVAEACERAGRAPAGCAARLKNVLRRYGLPYAAGEALDSYIDLCAHDKKMDKDVMHVVTIADIGNAQITDMRFEAFRNFMGQAQ